MRCVVNRVILYVDDNKEDAQLVQRAVATQSFGVEFHAVHDGCEAADWLAGCGNYGDREQFPIPDLLVLDLRMPTNSGFDLMEFVKARRELKKIPIIVYSASEDPADKKQAFMLGANAYVSKADGTDYLMTYVRSVVTSLPPP